ncbi:cation diffusion facilitator family transporter [Aciduricibacillus chroicocephali]|uniref:Cation diffusion facilitator family transporter n=1 Tax=Aciduricibacillus chroicocephali TaxID=3054939 RepID=A0ABY9KWW2_9BACI|nr:cation diffusion facilitator family transporter [Bacillaceae bacterium 44XB]
MKFLKDGARAVVTATWVGIIVNAFLTILKAVGGVLSGSRALIADALHSASDIVGSIVVLLAVKIANRPPDREHPYGHGKAENVASLIVAILLIIVGAEVAYSSGKIFFGERPVPPGKLALAIIIISILIKEVLFHYKYRLGKKYNSTALITEAWHHRSDSLSSLAALIGIGAAILGGKFNIPWLLYGDAVAGLAVSLIVVKVGYSLAKESSLVIMEKVLDDESVEPYIHTACSIDGVRRVDTIHARTHGSYLVIDLKLGINPDLSIEEGHRIGKRVKKQLMEKHSEVEDVLVHLNPYNDKN